MKKIETIGWAGRIAMFFLIIVAAAVMAGCASTTYFVERDKWPAFDTIIVEDVKVAEGVEMPADAVAEFNELLFAKIKEDLGGKYKVVRNTENKDALRLSFTAVRWWDPIYPFIRPWGMDIEITGKAYNKEMFKRTSSLVVGLMHSRDYFLKWSAVWASRRIEDSL